MLAASFAEVCNPASRLSRLPRDMLVQYLLNYLMAVIVIPQPGTRARALALGSHTTEILAVSRFDQKLCYLATIELPGSDGPVEYRIVRTRGVDLLWSDPVDVSACRPTSVQLLRSNRFLLTNRYATYLVTANGEVVERRPHSEAIDLLCPTVDDCLLRLHLPPRVSEDQFQSEFPSAGKTPPNSDVFSLTKEQYDGTIVARYVVPAELCTYFDDERLLPHRLLIDSFDKWYVICTRRRFVPLVGRQRKPRYHTEGYVLLCRDENEWREVAFPIPLDPDSVSIDDYGDILVRLADGFAIYTKFMLLRTIVKLGRPPTHLLFDHRGRIAYWQTDPVTVHFCE